MKTIGCAIAIFGLLAAGCATQFFPGELITVELRNAKASAATGETGHRTIDEPAALALLSAEEQQLLAAIHATEKAQGFVSPSWSVDDGVLQYRSFQPVKAGDRSFPIWMEVDWHRHTIQLFATEHIDRIAVVADALGNSIRASGLDATLTKTENSVPVRPGVFGGG